jgi:aspartate carbamoyltransferase regulatory subunit
MGEVKHLSVSAIKNGTVIDHIPADTLFSVINILGLEAITNQITFGTNLESKKFGKKGIIKVSDIYFTEEEINKIALVAPAARLNIIRDYEVVEKHQLTIPDEIESIVKCFNPACITNHEPVKTRFRIISKAPLRLKCHYCEKITDEEHLTII